MFTLTVQVRLKTAESDVYRRQILTSKVSPADHDLIVFLTFLLVEQITDIGNEMGV